MTLAQTLIGYGESKENEKEKEKEKENERKNFKFCHEQGGNNEMKTTKILYIKESLFALLLLAPFPWNVAVSSAQLW